MAPGGRQDSLLPTIKCSTCGVDIDMAALADHICASAAPAPKKGFGMNFFTRVGGSSNAPSSSTTDSTAQKGGRTIPPPKIDAAAANRPFLQPSQQTPASNYSSNYGKSPRTPLHNQAPSEDMSLGYDNPYPPFSASPYDSSSTMSLRNRDPISPNPSRNPRLIDGGKHDAPPMSPVDSIMRRANMIKPGPFDSWREEMEDSGFGHRRNKTSESIKEFRNRKGQDIFRRPSTANSQKDQGSMYAEFSMSNPFGDAPPVMAAIVPRPQAAPQQRLRPAEQIDRFLEQLDNDESYEASDSFSGPVRSKTDPLPKPPTSNPYFDKQNAKPSIRRARTDARLNGAPPVPIVPNIQKQFPGIASHSPTESASSDGSVFSSNTSISSRSSPPNSEGGGGWSRRPSDASNKPTRERDPYAQPRERAATVTANEPPLPQGRSRSRPTNGPPQFRKPSRDIDVDQSAAADPAIQMAGAILGSSRPSRRPSNPAFSKPSFFSNTKSSPPKPPPDPVFRPPTRTATEPASAIANLRRNPTIGTARSPCRGCGANITGRAIKAADDRLSGRWHKECFVCTTCKAPFPSGDFYVMRDKPYCDRHYHKLNNSICGSCDGGIEGQYLETDRGKKFHKACFTCNVCDIPLRDEYYEVKSKHYCERHAWSVAQKNAGIDPNGMGMGPGGRSRGGGLGAGLGNNMLQKRRTRMMFI